MSVKVSYILCWILSKMQYNHKNFFTETIVVQDSFPFFNCVKNKGKNKPIRKIIVIVICTVNTYTCKKLQKNTTY